MSLTITLSGVYRDPEARPLPGVTLVFETLYNSNQTQLKTAASCITGDDAFYSIDLVPNSYSVKEVIGKRVKWLGNIMIFADSPDGTLNEYLISFRPVPQQPDILSEMEEILEETKEAAANAGFNPRGPFEPTADYQKNDMVEYDGSEYLATDDVTGIVPPESPWQLFVAKGTDGTDGTDGENGPPNTLTVNDVQTLPAGEPATVEISGESPNQSLSFGIPQGKDGIDGKDGVDGESAYQIWLDAGNTGSEDDFLASLQGGDGKDGTDGESAYEIWLDAGNSGTEADFLASLQGADGDGFIWRDEFDYSTIYQKNDVVSYKGSSYIASYEASGWYPDDPVQVQWNLLAQKGGDGQDGESAYQIWLDAGNTGTEDDFLASLKGSDGKDGTDGEPGPPNTLTIGTVDTVPPGTGSSATITGDAPNQILNLSLEQGEPGEGADGGMRFAGNYQYGETYSLNDVVKITADGLYICIVETTKTVPGQSSDWQYTAGNINTIDGLGADEKGDMIYNMLIDVNESVVEPSLAGALSATLNINSSTTVDLTVFANPLFNTNPASSLRLYIDTTDATDAITVTFSNSDNYWLPDGSYSTDAPVFTLDSSQPMTRIEVTNVTISGVTGVMVQQVYPVAAESDPDTVKYKGAWQSGTTYHKGDEVSETVNGIPGLFICLVESSSAEPSGSSDWRRIAGTASDIDGVSATNGSIAYNRILDITTDTIKPQSGGELTWTYNITESVTVDLIVFANPLFNTNPAAVIRLVVCPVDTATITFTNSDNYWLADGTYSTDAPVFELDSTQPLTIIELTNVTVASIPGVMVRQVYPSVSSDGSNDVIIPDVGEPGSSGSFMHVNNNDAGHYPGETFAATAIYYAGINDGGNLIQGSGGHPTGGTWQLRGYFQIGTTAGHSAAALTRIDGTNLMSATHLLQATAVSDRVRNCRYSAADNSMVDCEVLVGAKWYPFTASPADSTTWGPAIYNAAVAGLFGEVAPYLA